MKLSTSIIAKRSFLCALIFRNQIHSVTQLDQIHSGMPATPPLDGGGYSRVSLEESLKQVAMRRETHRNLCNKGFEEKLQYTEYLEHIRGEFPKLPELKEKPVRFPKDQARSWCISACFACSQEGVPAPWLRSEYESAAAQFHIVSVIEKDKTFYISALEQDFGSLRLLIVFDPVDLNTADVEQLLTDLTTDKGGIAQFGIKSVNRVLREYGSPTHIAVATGTREYCLDAYKVDLSDHPSRRVIQFTGKDGKGGYLFNPGGKPIPRFSVYPSEPGGFMFTKGQDLIVRPLARRVLSRISVQEPFEVCSEDKLVMAVGRMQFPKTVFGEQLPKVVAP